ncbi:MAG TPA: F0F1 ATP synthase subunit epsilon [Candidatus Saccharimonadales bacterium]|nr:F0F1 ATP synthase subunit epsilon [Candidatus Saccharimonadales bacterium]
MGSGQEFKVSVLSAEKTVFEGDVECLLIPSTRGQVAILPLHTPMILLMTAGIVYVVQNQKKKKITEVKTGIVRVDDNDVYVLVNL